MGYATATATPVVRTAYAGLADWPSGVPPLKAVLVSDIHVAGPDMPPARLVAIVAQINALRPHVVLLAGDFVSDRRTAARHYSTAESIAPLAGLDAPLGAVAVYGNHDHWRDADASRAELRRAGIALLDNQAATFGPLAIGGLDDAFTKRADLAATVAALRRTAGARVLLSHSPDPFPQVPGDIGLMLAGHTHCGQIVLPVIGPIATMSAHGRRYACGIVEENGKTLVVGAGVGTSVLPLRIGARPDLWLLTIGPKR